MNSLAALKRRIQVGSRLECLAHTRPEVVGTTRTVIETQTNGYYYTLNTDPEQKRFWHPYAKATAYTFPDENTYRQSEGGFGWTLRFLEAA